MSDIVIKVENLSKQYRLGTIGTGTITHDLNRWWAKVRGKEDPYLKIGQDSNSLSDEYFMALQDVNFDIKGGEAIGIIGRNGAGKSTLLKVLSRVTSPTTGSLKIKGRIASLLEVGTGFHPELTGRENIFLNGAILGMTKQEIRSKFDEIVSFSGVEQYIDTPVKRYSSGMYVRLAFAVAAHLEPEILIIDEVLAVGDAAFQKKCLGKMKDVAGEGRTVLFVSHQLGMVRELCSEGILLRQGKVVYQGPSMKALDLYTQSIESSETDNHHFFEEDEDLKAQMLEIRLENEVGKVESAFDVFDKIVFKARYLVRESLVGLSFNVVVERNGEPLFLTFDTDNSPQLLDERVPGIYETEVVFPSPLKAGRYTVHVGLGILRMSGIHSKREALIFNVEEKSFNESMKSYGSSRIGIMATSLQWKTKNG